METGIPKQMLVSRYRGPQGIGLEIFYVSLTLIDAVQQTSSSNLRSCGGGERKPGSSFHAE